MHAARRAAQHNRAAVTKENTTQQAARAVSTAAMQLPTQAQGAVTMSAEHEDCIAEAFLQKLVVD